MTIRMQHLTISPDDAAWILDGENMDLSLDGMFAVDLLSAVRHIMRERECSMIPVVRAFTLIDTDPYGSNALIEVSYDRNSDWRAVYGLHVGGEVSKVQCYMD